MTAKNNPTCNCPPDSPFRWREHTGPSIFAQDSQFQPKGKDGIAASDVATRVVQQKKTDTGVSPGTMYGISRKADELLIQKQISVYSKAKAKEKK